MQATAPRGRAFLLAALCVFVGLGLSTSVAAQPDGPSMVDPNLGVRAVAGGFQLPTAVAFLGPNDMLVLEKDDRPCAARRRRHRPGHGARPRRELGSERGLLGHRAASEFPANPGVYLYWTESTTGADTNVASRHAAARQPRRPLRLERLDADVRRNLITIRAIQAGRRAAGARQPRRRRDPLRSRTASSTSSSATSAGAASCRTCRAARPRRARAPTVAGRSVRRAGAGRRAPDRRRPAPQRRRHDAGRQPVLRRRRRDGRRGRRERPEDLLVRPPQRLRHGLRPALRRRSGCEENGDDTFSELNRVEPGMNGGWVQIMGPVERIAQFKADRDDASVRRNLQQLRWPPTNIADTPGGGAVAALHAPRRALQRSGVQLEVGGRARGRSASSTSRALGPQYRGRPVHGRRDADCSKAATCSAST